MELQKEITRFGSKGSELFRRKMSEEGLVCFNRAIKLDSKNALTYFKKSMALNGIGKNKEALSCIDQAICCKPNNFGYYASKGDILRGMGRNEEAIDCYDKVISLNP